MRILSKILLLTAVLIPLSLRAQIYEPVSLAINSENGIYALGDSVKITATIRGGAEDKLLLRVLRYGEEISKKTFSLPEGETVIYADAFPEATSIIVNLGPASNPKVSTAIGFLVAPENFRPGFPTPGNLTQYWQKEVKRLRKLKPVVKTYPAVFDDNEKTDVSQFECYRIEINMPDGRPCRGYVAYPKGAKLVVIHFPEGGVLPPARTVQPTRKTSILILPKRRISSGRPA